MELDPRTPVSKIDLETAAWLEGYPDGETFLNNDRERASYYLGRTVNASGEIDVDDKKE